jgi:hypothetical protein
LSKCESVQDFDNLFIYVLPLEIQLSREDSWVSIKQFKLCHIFVSIPRQDLDFQCHMSDMGKFEIHEKSSNWHCHEENEPAILSKYTCVFVLLINICNIFQKNLSIFYEKKVKTVMVNSATNNNKTNNCL